MFLTSITDRTVVHALSNTLAFNEARLKVIAENVANMQTPGYRARQVDEAGFRQALGEAVNAGRRDPGRPFRVSAEGVARTDEAGRLQVTPSERPPDNVLFHDGTNLSIEREMADLAKTGLLHEQAASLLRGHLDGLRKAIRGTVG
jgi:flagellar basal-body rod protein FlgB